MAMDRTGEDRAAFWRELAAAAPDLGLAPGPGQEREVPIGGIAGLKLKLSLSQDKTSVYLVARSPEAAGFLAANLAALGAALMMTPGKASGEAAQGRWFRKEIKDSVALRSRWPVLAEFFLTRVARYDAAVRAVAASRPGA
jgi:hypothetical protein